MSGAFQVPHSCILALTVYRKLIRPDFHRAGAALENDIRISTTRVDVSDDSSVTSWINNLMTEFGRLDGCANVAGIAGGDGSTTVQTLV